MSSVKALLKDERIEIRMQLIISPNRDFTAGVEALARGLDSEGNWITPLDLFQKADAEGLMVELDQLLVQKALRTFSDSPECTGELLLFINLSDALIKELKGSSWLLEKVQEYGLEPKNIVFDINPKSDRALHDAYEFTEAHRKMGFYICVDDIGANHYNLDTILFLNPDIIKINIAQIRKMTNRSYQRNLVRYLKQIADQQGILMVSKGLENQRDIQESLEHGVQFMQGFHVSEPVDPNQVPIGNIITRYHETFGEYAETEMDSAVLTRMMTSKAIAIGKEFAVEVSDGNLEQQQSEGFFAKYPFIENIWLLDKTGKQTGDTIINAVEFTAKSSPMFQIFNHGSDFSGKELYRQLTDTILDVWVTKPYKSILTNNPVIGCSMYLESNQDGKVLCMNFNYSRFATYLSIR